MLFASTIIIISLFLYLSRGFSHFFLKVRGRERPHRDLNPVPHWLAEVNLSLPLTIIVYHFFFICQ